ncbi:hypothetical protein ACC685_33460 [Rhizobium ruizarguesonis]
MRTFTRKSLSEIRTIAFFANHLEKRTDSLARNGDFAFARFGSDDEVDIALCEAIGHLKLAAIKLEYAHQVGLDRERSSVEDCDDFFPDVPSWRERRDVPEEFRDETLGDEFIRFAAEH